MQKGICINNKDHYQRDVNNMLGKIIRSIENSEISSDELILVMRLIKENEILRQGLDDIDAYIGTPDIKQSVLFPVEDIKNRVRKQIADLRI